MKYKKCKSREECDHISSCFPISLPIKIKKIPKNKQTPGIRLEVRINGKKHDTKV